MEQLKTATTDKTTFVLDHRVSSIQKQDSGFIVDDEFWVKSIIIATGTGSFAPKKFPLQLDTGAAARIHYFIKNPQEFANQTIGVFGGGDSALDWALELAEQTGTQVGLIHRRNEFRGLESSAQRLQNLKNVEVLTPYLPKSIAIRNNQLDVGLKLVGSTELIHKHFDQIIVAYGFRSNNSFVKKWGVNISNSQIAVTSEMKTSVPGIYAIGDAVTYPGRVPVIGLGFGEAQIAVTAIMRSLFPEKTLTIHSTSI
ncbi:ferredoxin--NADP reductase [Lactobacillus xylocopicola]|uniref:Ferredoxin--NADP reductase n=1 Tax=Lactobacillus xylocopicola TaxID=2976676 RepID=A0ABN6SKD1_9LACO|nr:ferredoxin--NADP reductase [Lactobacillus xylocopicola]